MSRAARRPRAKREPAIALINVVFLMLIFFLIAGSVAPPMDERVELVDTKTLEGRPPPDAAVILEDGSLLFQGAPVTPSEIVEANATPRIVPDRALPGARLMEIVGDLRRAGAEEVWIVTARGLDE
jgi:biopolymer transport protein ExbD